jgi:hypothetical protein
MLKIRKDAMRTKERKSARQKSRQQTRAEKKAVKKFNDELQKAVDKVDWAKVELPKWRD